MHIILTILKIILWIILILIALALLRLERRNGKDGELLVWYLLLYGTGRFLLEFFRSDPRGTVGVFSTSQFISLFIVAAGVVLALSRRKRSEAHGTSR